MTDPLKFDPAWVHAHENVAGSKFPLRFVYTKHELLQLCNTALPPPSVVTELKEVYLPFADRASKLLSKPVSETMSLSSGYRPPAISSISRTKPRPGRRSKGAEGEFEGFPSSEGKFRSPWARPGAPLREPHRPAGGWRTSAPGESLRDSMNNESPDEQSHSEGDWANHPPQALQPASTKLDPAGAHSLAAPFDPKNKPLSRISSLNASATQGDGKSLRLHATSNPENSQSVPPGFQKEEKSEQHKWLYKDPRGNIQGPFENNDMLDWYQRGFFKGDLLLKRSIDEDFIPLGFLIKSLGRVPFFPKSGSNSLPAEEPVSLAPKHQPYPKSPESSNNSNWRRQPEVPVAADHFPGKQSQPAFETRELGPNSEGHYALRNPEANSRELYVQPQDVSERMRQMHIQQHFHHPHQQPHLHQPPPQQPPPPQHQQPQLLHQPLHHQHQPNPHQQLEYLQYVQQQQQYEEAMRQRNYQAFLMHQQMQKQIHEQALNSGAHPIMPPFPAAGEPEKPSFSPHPSIPIPVHSIEPQFRPASPPKTNPWKTPDPSESLPKTSTLDAGFPLNQHKLPERPTASFDHSEKSETPNSRHLDALHTQELKKTQTQNLANPEPLEIAEDVNLLLSDNANSFGLLANMKGSKSKAATSVKPVNPPTAKKARDPKISSSATPSKKVKESKVSVTPQSTLNLNTSCLTISPQTPPQAASVKSESQIAQSSTTSRSEGNHASNQTNYGSPGACPWSNTDKQSVPVLSVQEARLLEERRVAHQASLKKETAPKATLPVNQTGWGSRETEKPSVSLLEIQMEQERLAQQNLLQQKETGGQNVSGGGWNQIAKKNVPVAPPLSHVQREQKVEKTLSSPVARGSENPWKSVSKSTQQTSPVASSPNTTHSSKKETPVHEPMSTSIWNVTSERSQTLEQKSPQRLELSPAATSEANSEIVKWVRDKLKPFKTNLEASAFVNFLENLGSEPLIISNINDTLGYSVETSRFAKEYLSLRSSNPLPVDEDEISSVEVKKGKKKKKKHQKLDSSLLGYRVDMGNTINRGEIQEFS